MKIEFKRSGKTLAWDRASGSILDVAESQGLWTEPACRTGACGNCKMKLLSGRVRMDNEGGLSEEDKAEDMILACVAAPETDVALDA